ncbi:gp13.1 protein [Escherichia phage K1E]|uniref:Gp13.1 protein n=1 Tax=Escherichia phage K1E TaxID=344022 RepID=Q2WC13_BPK1E|nr:hypothetical protein PK1Ep21 [Escherichia phage K1E]CAJ29418.1 gp13.1 protein [Escherichia phage K1E]
MKYANAQMSMELATIYLLSLTPLTFFTQRDEEIARQYGVSLLSLVIGRLASRKTFLTLEETVMTRQASSGLALTRLLLSKRFPWVTGIQLSKCSMIMDGKVLNLTIPSKRISMSMAYYPSLGVGR